MGSRGGASGGRGDKVKTSTKTNRDGSLNLSWGETIQHIGANTGFKVSGGKDWSVEATPTCGSCHDPASRRRR